MVIFASWADAVWISPPTPLKTVLSRDSELAAPDLVELTWSSQAPSATLTAAAEAPMFAPLIAEATADRLRSPVDTTATSALPTRSGPSRCSVNAPAPVDTATVPPVPAEVIATGGLVPIRTAPSTPFEVAALRRK